MMYRTATVTPILYKKETIANVSPILSNEIINVSAQLSDQIISAEAKLNDNLVQVSAELTTDVLSGKAAIYDGEYSFTPTQSTQTIGIKGKVAKNNITINPIPSNYGLITWNGAVLTVS